jgi:hypothetical protein
MTQIYKTTFGVLMNSENLAPNTQASPEKLRQPLVSLETNLTHPKIFTKKHFTHKKKYVTKHMLFELLKKQQEYST